MKVKEDYDRNRGTTVPVVQSPSNPPIIAVPKIDIAVPKMEPSFEKSVFIRTPVQAIPRSPIPSDYYFLENDFYLDMHRFC